MVATPCTYPIVQLWICYKICNNNKFRGKYNVLRPDVKVSSSIENSKLCIYIGHLKKKEKKGKKKRKATTSEMELFVICFICQRLEAVNYCLKQLCLRCGKVPGSTSAFKTRTKSRY